MFNMFKADKGTKIIAPVSGKIVSLENIPDEVFSQKMVGDGVAIDPNSEFIVAPCDGVIEKIFETNHAFSIKSTEGIEIFVHYGVDTVNLKGEGFSRLVEQGSTVKSGDLILKTDLPFLRSKAKSVLTAVIISNMDEIKSFKITKDKEALAGKTVIVEVLLK